MTNEEYLEVQSQIILLANLIRRMKLKEFIHDAERVDTVGPFVDPTLWAKSQKNLAIIKGLARKLLAVQDEAMISLPPLIEE